MTFNEYEYRSGCSCYGVKTFTGMYLFVCFHLLFLKFETARKSETKSNSWQEEMESQMLTSTHSY